MDQLFIRPVSAELHEQLPWWVGYASIVSMVLLWSLGSLLLGGIGAAVASIPMVGSRGKPWHERARQAYSLRVMLLMQMMVWPMVALVICSIWPLPFAFQSLALRCFPPALASLGILALLRFAGERRILGGRHSIGQLMRNTVVYHFALGHVTLVVAVLATITMPWKFDVSVLVILLITTAAIAFLACGGSLVILRGLRLLKPADERLNRIVAESAAQVGASVPISYIARMPSANALAFPWNARLAFSEGILQNLNDEQLGSIAAHEICHLGMPRSQKLMRLAHAMSLLIPITLTKPIWGQFGTAAILPSLIALLVVIVVLQVLGRRLMQREEERADRAGAEANEAVYALALEQVYRDNLMPANVRSPQGHPPLYDRMVASGVTPDYEKPRPPPVWIRHLAMLTQMAVFLAITTFLVVAYAVTMALAPKTIASQRCVLAVAGGRMADVSRLGELHIDAGDEAIGLSLLEYAKDQAPHDAEVLARLSMAYANNGRCDEAEQLLREAEANEDSLRKRSDEVVAAARQAVSGCQ